MSSQNQNSLYFQLEYIQLRKMTAINELQQGAMGPTIETQLEFMERNNLW